MTSNTNKQLRAEISKILVKWSMPTREVAISEIVALFNKLEVEAVGLAEEALDMCDSIDCCHSCMSLNDDLHEEYKKLRTRLAEWERGRDSVTAPTDIGQDDEL